MSTETDLHRIVSALEGRKEGNSWRCRCPCHDGRSLIVTLDGERLLCNCKSGCSQEDVIGALKERGLWPNGATPGPTAGELQEEYGYRLTSEPDQVAAVKGRFSIPGPERKTFRWRLAEAPGGPNVQDWKGLQKRYKEADLALYGSQHLSRWEGPVFMVEGEKGAKACLPHKMLALCPAGGASTKDFGESLSVLAGRDMILWPDNDDEGRALMQRIAIRLQGIAASVRTICPDVPPKGDAFDYFQNGGNKDALLEDAAKIKTAPEIEPTPTGYRVTIPASGGAAILTFESLEERPHALQAEVTAWVEMPGMPREPFSGRLNVLSLSNRESFRRQLEDMVPLAKGEWTQLLNRACAMVRQAHAEADPSVDLAVLPITDTSTRYLQRPFVLEDGSAVVFGPGGTGKTYLDLLLAVGIAKGCDIFGQPCIQRPVLYVDYESTAVRIKARLLRILEGMDLDWADLPFTYWPGRGRPLAEMVPALQRKIRETDTGLLIVDSAALAAGGEPEKAEVALRYFNALAALEIPSLTIAHVTKAEEDQHPFGSVFWHNSARLTWNIKIEHDEGRDVAHLGLFNRKANDERLHPPIGIRMEFDGAAVRFSKEDLQAGITDRANLTARIRGELRSGSRSVKQMAQTLGESTGMIRARVNQMHDTRPLGKADDSSGLWGLKADG